jgi:hypothetical protein
MNGLAPPLSPAGVLILLPVVSDLVLVPDTTLSYRCLLYSDELELKFELLELVLQFLVGF